MIYLNYYYYYYYYYYSLHYYYYYYLNLFHYYYYYYYYSFYHYDLVMLILYVVYIDLVLIHIQLHPFPYLLHPSFLLFWFFVCFFSYTIESLIICFIVHIQSYTHSNT